jgi:6-pyruvoyltetrahydropterin/6-carboxytetrahydropterin synthase
MITVTLKVEFCAAHRLYNPAWDDAKNREVFGKCSNPHGHGHNYVMRVSVSGPLDEESGMIVNVSTLGAALKREVVDTLDHRNLNTDVDFLSGVITTMENIAMKLAERLVPTLKAMGLTLVRLELSESNTNSVTLELA